MKLTPSILLSARRQSTVFCNIIATTRPFASFTVGVWKQASNNRSRNYHRRCEMIIWVQKIQLAKDLLAGAV